MNLPNPKTDYLDTLRYNPEVNLTRLAWDWNRKKPSAFPAKNIGLPPSRLPAGLFPSPVETWLDVGAGTGSYFRELSRQHLDKRLIAIERDRFRGTRMAQRKEGEGFIPVRGNIIVEFSFHIPAESLDKVFILYPCPWPKNSQRKNRWYLHPVFNRVVRALKPGGEIIWASDQKFYIDEATWMCTEKHGLHLVTSGAIQSTEPRTQFEKTFFLRNHPCHELVVRKRGI